MTLNKLDWMETPAHWDKRKAKYTFAQMKRPVRPDDQIVTAFRDGTVTLRANRRTEGFTNSDKEIGYQGVRKGDLVIHTMDGFAGAIGVSDSDGKCTPVYSVCQPIIPASTRFFAHLIRFLAKSGYIESLSRGIRERSTEFRYKEFGEIELPIPPFHEQNAIANYLDQEMTKLNVIVEKSRRLVELLELKKRSEIIKAITEGLDLLVQKTASKIPWLENIPNHWLILPFFTLFKERNERNIENGNTNVLSLSYGRIIQRNVENNYGLFPESFETYQIVAPGNIVLRLTDLQNDKKSLRVGLVREQGIITSAYVCLQPNEKIIPEYAYYLLHAYDILKVFYTLGGGVRQTMRYEDLKHLPILIPPIDEQLQIVDRINRKTESIEHLTQKLEKMIELLLEYRLSLISSATTGKIETE